MPDYNEVKPKPVEAVDPKEEAKVVEPKKKLKPIAHVQKRKRNVVERLVVALIGPDGIPAISKYLSHEVILPAVKDIVANSLTTGIQMAIFGKDGVSARPAPGPTGQRYYSSASGTTQVRHVDYSSHARYHTPNDKTQRGQDRASSFNSENYVLDDLQGAREALANLQEQADQYDTVSLADFYDLMGEDTVYTDNNYGWLYDDIMKGKVVMVAGGYALRLPRLDVLAAV